MMNVWGVDIEESQNFIIIYVIIFFITYAITKVCKHQNSRFPIQKSRTFNQKVGNKGYQANAVIVIYINVLF